jgi:uncharacterized membrane protein YtjA (UPF0391 family)
VPVHWGIDTCSLLKEKITAPGSAKYTLNRIRGAPLHIYPWFRLEDTNSFRPNLGGTMLYWTLVFLVIALIAGVLGFTGVAIAAAGVAKLLFFVFLVLFVISLVTHLTRRGSV